MSGSVTELYRELSMPRFARAMKSLQKLYYYVMALKICIYGYCGNSFRARARASIFVEKKGAAKM